MLVQPVQHAQKEGSASQGWMVPILSMLAMVAFVAGVTTRRRAQARITRFVNLPSEEDTLRMHFETDLEDLEIE